MVLAGLGYSIDARAQTPLPPPEAKQTEPAANPTNDVLDRLYRLVWPAGRFEGNLDKLIQRTTQKTSAQTDLPRLYLVNVRLSTASEWRTARGAVEPAFCNRQQLLFYRRGNRLVREQLEVKNESVAIAGNPTVVAGIDIRHLHACVEDAVGVALYVDDASGKLRLLSVAGLQTIWRDVQGAAATTPDSSDIATQLRKFAGARPDGTSVAVSDHRLVGERARTDERFLVLSSPLRFFGDPVWLGTGEFLLANASAAAR